MIRGLKIREAIDEDRAAIGGLVCAAFGRADEARLVDLLIGDGDDVLELVAIGDDGLVGHVLFSRLRVETGGMEFSALSLGPVAVLPALQKSGIGTTLIEHAHAMLEQTGEQLSVVLGEPAYYGRFGYRHERAAGFSSDYQCPALQALAWGTAPSSGRLVYPSAFSAL